MTYKVSCGFLTQQWGASDLMASSWGLMRNEHWRNFHRPFSLTPFFYRWKHWKRYKPGQDLPTSEWRNWNWLSEIGKLKLPPNSPTLHYQNNCLRFISFSLLSLWSCMKILLSAPISMLKIHFCFYPPTSCPNQVCWTKPQAAPPQGHFYF